MLTCDCFNRVYALNFGRLFGTAFTIDIDSRQYLVTARHVVQGIGAKDVVLLRNGGVWKSLDVTVVGIGCLEDDVAVFSPAVQLSRKEFDLRPTSAGAVISQDVYMVGFPFGLETTVGPGSVPLVKKATLMGMCSPATQAGTIGNWVLDAINNQGFSGGPVVFRPGEDQRAPLQVLGVISAYRTVPQPVYRMEADKKRVETDLYSDQNTGLAIAINIKSVSDLVNQNPIGCAVKI